MEEKIEELKRTCTVNELTEVTLDDITGPCKLHELALFTKLEFLSFKNNGLTSLKGLPKMPLLKKLDLSSNKLTSTLFFLMNCPQLTHLNLSNNQIKEAIAFKPLGKLKNLQSLLLVNNEVTKISDYRKKVFRRVKSLKDLDGEDKTQEDSMEPTPEDDPMNGGGGVKRKAEGDTKSRKKRKSMLLKTPLMQLNELKPGLQYIVDSMSGPAHEPKYVVTVEVNEIKYSGQGNSKQSAKHAAAQAALSSFVQFRDAPNVFATVKSFQSSDFTSDVKNEDMSFDSVGLIKNGAESHGKMDVSLVSPAIRKSLKILTEADKKNPVMLLNEIHPGLQYNLKMENNAVPSQRFLMTVEVNGVTYEGTGPNKKLAKTSAARSVMSNLYKVSYTVTGASLLSLDSPEAELFNFPQAIADKISKKLMVTFNEVMTGNSEHAKWKIIAGIAMTKDKDMNDIQIISFGTGTKCISGEHISLIGANLNDCHAEIISRRCLKDFLYTNLELHLEGEGDQSIFQKLENGGFCLKPNMKFHLYISTAPCGDSRIFCPHEEGVYESADRHPNRNSRGLLRTKIESGEGTIPVKPGQGVQTFDGILPGQERLLTMSCSDKLAAWNVLGMQGSLLSYFLEPIYLDSIVLGSLFHPDHLQRAVFGRLEKTLKDLPPKYSLHKPKMCATSSPETRHLVKSPNFSVNWTTGLGRAEVINATTGKTESNQASRLAKRSFFHRFMNIYDRLPHNACYDPPAQGLYSSYKAAVKQHQAAKKALHMAFSEARLGNWVKKPVEQNEFELFL